MIIEKIKRVMELAVLLNEGGKKRVLLRYHGHVESMDVDIYEDGWTVENNGNCSKRFDFYLRKDNGEFSEYAEGNLDEVIAYMEGLK